MENLTELVTCMSLTDLLSLTAPDMVKNTVEGVSEKLAVPSS